MLHVPLLLCLQTTTWNENLFQLHATHRGNLVTSVGPGTIQLWRPSTGKLLAHIRGGCGLIIVLSEGMSPLVTQLFLYVDHQTPNILLSVRFHHPVHIHNVLFPATILLLMRTVYPWSHVHDNMYSVLCLFSGQSSSTHCLDTMGEQLISVSSNGHVVIHNCFERTVSCE